MSLRQTVKQINRGEAGLGIALFLVGCLLLIHSLLRHAQLSVSIWLSPYLLPLLISLLLLSLSTLTFVKLCLRPAASSPPSATASRRPLGIALLLIAYLLVLPYAGFIVSTAIFLFVAMYLLGEQRLWLMLLLAVLGPLLLWLLFSQGLHVLLPAGRWWS